MGRCKICDKKGLFLFVDAQGRCSECAMRIAKEENEKFNDYYADLLFCYAKIKEKIDFGNDPVLALRCIPEIENKIKVCESLQEKLQDPKYRKHLANKLINSIEYRDDFSQKYGLGTLADWEISVHWDAITHEYSVNEIFISIQKIITSYKQKWAERIKSIQNSADFQKMIDAIPSVKIEITDTTHAKHKASELDELIKYSNVTPKTSFDRVGNFIVIDIETTGLSSTTDRIAEIAAVKFEDWIPVEKFHTLLNPEKHISEEASAINHITDEMVLDSPTFSQVIDSLEEFIGSSNIVGHNLPFDLKFVYRYGYNITAIKRRYYDTCEFAKKVLKKPKMKWDRELEDYIINDSYDYDVDDYKLTTLCDYYNIRDNLFAHRALSDALATGLLFKHLAQDRIDY